MKSLHIASQNLNGIDPKEEDMKALYEFYEVMFGIFSAGFSAPLRLWH